RPPPREPEPHAARDLEAALREEVERPAGDHAPWLLGPRATDAKTLPGDDLRGNAERRQVRDDGGEDAAEVEEDARGPRHAHEHLLVARRGNTEGDAAQPVQRQAPERPDHPPGPEADGVRGREDGVQPGQTEHEQEAPRAWLVARGDDAHEARRMHDE